MVVGRDLEIADVGEHDLRALAAELERDGLDVRLADGAQERPPTSVEPVNAILSTPGCRASAAPMTAPGPGTTLRTPSGRPASAASSARRRAVSGDCEAGLSTTELPVARAAPSFQAVMISG